MGGAKHFDFTLEPADPAKLASVCRWLQTSPTSIFTQAVLAYRFTPDEIVTLLGRVVRRVRPGVCTDSLIEGPEDLVAVLRQEFGIDLPEAAELWPSISATHEALHNTEA